MTLLSYQIFKTVVDQGSFQKAAQILSLTPSAVSHAVAGMEQELGFLLFNRRKSGVTLTNYGEQLLPYVNSVLTSDSNLRQAILEFNGLEQGHVKIGCFSSVCTNWIPGIIHSFQKKYPGVTIEIYQGTYADVSCWIKNGIVDLGFLSVSSAEDLPIEPLYRDPLLCVVPKGFPKSKEHACMTVEEMQGQSFVSQMESTDADIQNFLKTNEINIHTGYHVVDDLSTVAMVAAGFGICIMPEMVMWDIPYSVDCYPIEPAAYRIIGISALDPEFMAPAAKSMYQHILQNSSAIANHESES